jgi:CRISPR-associated endonuclease/helicase Cas3
LVDQVANQIEAWIRALGPLLPSDLRVTRLLGGAIDPHWDEFPDQPQILVGTQDQLLSRAINRGYAMSRYRWPMAMALLNNDVQWIIDEVQLMGAGLYTTAQLQAFRESYGTFGPARTLWMSATLSPDWLKTPDFDPSTGPVWKLTSEDRAHSEISIRFYAEKRLEQSPVALSSASPIETYALAVAQQAQQLHRSGELTLVLLNQVQRAQAVYRALKELVPDGDIVLLHSRFRRPDRMAMEQRAFSQVLPWGRIIVATQAIEAGVDISGATLVTELASWTSLVQRFGRCNRDGQASGGGLVHWIDIDLSDVKTADKTAYPYRPEDLQAARDILASLKDVSLATLSGVDPECVKGSRVRYQILRKRDLEQLFDTTRDLTGADINVARFVRDTTDSDVTVLWRDIAEERPLDMNAPGDNETCSVSMRMLRDYLELKGKKRRARLFNPLTQGWELVPKDRIHPGQVLLLDAALGGYQPDLGFVPEDTSLVAPESLSPEPLETYRADSMSQIGRFVTLEAHLCDTEHEARQLATLIDESAEKEALVRAAKHHDWGKAHPVFQEMVRLCKDDTPVDLASSLWAKSACRSGTYTRPYFRHELASALAWLVQGGDDLTAYLIAAHHGKVRMSIRSMPGEKAPDDHQRLYARGVWDGDELPPVPMPDGGELPEVSLNLEYMLLGRGDEGPSWLARTVALLDRYGPFRLAYLEALVRIADWRATEKERDAHV